MKYIILSVALVSLLFSCDNPYNKESEGLNNLLQEFNTGIAVKNHLYVLIPTFSCLGCVQSALINLNGLLVDNDKPNVTIIYQKIDVDLNPFKDKAIVYQDINSSIDKMPFNIVNLTVIKTSKGKINDIQFVNSENINQIINPTIIYEIRK